MENVTMVLLTATPMDNLLTELGLVVTKLIAWVGNVGTLIVGNPILLLTTGVMVFGAAIGIFGRLLSKN